MQTQRTLQITKLPKDTRGNGRIGKMWSARERVGTETGIPSVFRSQRRLPAPSRRRSLFPVPAVYRPDLRHLVPVPSVSRFVVMCMPTSASRTVRLATCSHPVPTFAHTVSPIPQLTLEDAHIPFSMGCVFPPP